ncbi:MAG: hypothetical protein AB7R00_19825 [Kofleriaceae bacterium]
MMLCSSLAACQPDKGVGINDGEDSKSLLITEDLDILFVIDDSPSMADKQANLRANFPAFMAALESLPGGLPNVHIGVVTSDVGTKSTLDPDAGSQLGQLGMGGCAGTGKSGVLRTGTMITGNFIRDIEQPDGTRSVNYTGTLADAFSEIASVGAGGCGFEQHLHAMKLALDEHPDNAGFLRDDAMLAVVFLADEDDCSLSRAQAVADDPTLGPLQSFRCTRFGVTCDQGGETADDMNVTGPKGQCHPGSDTSYLDDVADYVSFLQGLKADPRLVVVGGIIGDAGSVAVELLPPPSGGNPIPTLVHSCSYQGAFGLEVADPAVRLQWLLDQFPGQSVSTSICQADLTGGLGHVGQTIRRALLK